MYGPPPATTTPAGSSAARLGSVPLVAMCCLGLVLLLIASTIVLALIPVYLKTRSISPAVYTQSYYTTGNFDGSLGNDGQLDNTANSQIARAMDTQLGLPAGSVSVTSATVATTPSKRKRRKFGLTRVRRGQTNFGVQRLYIIFRLNRGICGGCFLRTTNININVTIVYNGVTFTLTISMTISSAAINIPSTMGSFTTTAAITTSTTTAVTSNAIG